MIIKEVQFSKCPHCGDRKRVSDEEYGCDECGNPIALEVNGKRHNDYLDMTVHHHTDPARHLQFCSWKCVIAFLPKIKTGYFASLPYLQFEADVLPGQRAEDFFRLIGARK